MPHAGNRCSPRSRGDRVCPATGVAFPSPVARAGAGLPPGVGQFVDHGVRFRCDRKRIFAPSARPWLGWPPAARQPLSCLGIAGLQQGAARRSQANCRVSGSTPATRSAMLSINMRFSSNMVSRSIGRGRVIQPAQRRQSAPGAGSRVKSACTSATSTSSDARDERDLLDRIVGSAPSQAAAVSGGIASASRERPARAGDGTEYRLAQDPRGGPAGLRRPAAGAGCRRKPARLHEKIGTVT